MKIVPTIVLATVWCALTYEFSAGNAAVGLVLGGALSLLYRTGRQQPGERRDVARGLRRSVRRLRAAAVLGIAFFWDLISSSVRLGFHVLKPRHVWDMAIVPVGIAPRSDHELILVSTLITLTPGTLTVDVAVDRSTLYVHVMAAEDPEGVRHALEQGVVRRVREFFA